MELHKEGYCLDQDYQLGGHVRQLQEMMDASEVKNSSLWKNKDILKVELENESIECAIWEG